MKNTSGMQLYSIPEAALLLAVSTKTVRRLIAARRITAIKINRRILLSEAALADFLESCTIEKIDAEGLARRMLGA